ncbi:MAG TPA: protoporphyrinogen oxidase [Acidimicrobiales bacterium]|nr:protoporphyrinogen oxidase [Acidimicrobiales bacterium]
MTRKVDLAVVGGGISGLAAAWAGMQQGADVVVLEAGATPGGKLRTSPVAGVGLDEGADAFLARVPEAVELCEQVGLGAELVSPATGTAYVWSEGSLRRLPSEQLLGVPTDLDAVEASGILSAAGVERARADLTAPGDAPSDGDEAIGALVRRRLGGEVLDRLVAPLLGGIWAGDCDRLSLRVAAPNLAAARDRDASLVRGAAALRAEAAEQGATDRPVFLAPRGGVARLVDALAERLGQRLRCGATVIGLEPDGAGWRLATGEAAGPVARRHPAVLADRVLLATPAFVTAPLLKGIAPDVAAFLAGIDYASVVLTTLVVRRDGIDHPLDGSGFLVPQSSGRLLTACSWMTSKWAHLDVDPSTAILRASAGREGDERARASTDHELVAALLEDLRHTMGLHAAPTEVRVSRWGRSLPQPRPGHLDALATAERALADRAPGLALAGAWALGVGIPACIRAAGRAVHG